jgi:hypothetical protein
MRSSTDRAAALISVKRERPVRSNPPRNGRRGGAGAAGAITPAGGCDRPGAGSLTIGVRRDALNKDE